MAPTLTHCVSFAAPTIAQQRLKTEASPELVKKS